MNNELGEFIDGVYRESYRLLGNNCIDKSLRIKARAESHGVRADFIMCLIITRVRVLGGFPLISPHFYTIIEGEKVDVALDPDLEKVVGKNAEQKTVLAVNLSALKRFLLAQGQHYFGRAKAD